MPYKERPDDVMGHAAGYYKEDWETFGPDGTTQPEPTQHALEKSQALRERYSGPQEFNRYGDGSMSGRMTMSSPSFTELENRVIEKETADSLERQAERLLARAAEVREKYSRFGEDDFPEGAIIVFDKRFNEYGGRSIPWSKPYHYAALKAAGLWSTTGPRSPKAYSWAELIRWMGDGVEEIHYVSELTKFVG